MKKKKPKISRWQTKRRQKSNQIVTHSNRNSEFKWHFSQHNLWNNTTIETDPIFCSTSSVWPRTSCLCHLFWISVIQPAFGNALRQRENISHRAKCFHHRHAFISRLSLIFESEGEKIWILWTRIHSIFTGRQWKTADESASKNRQIKTQNNF